MVFTRSFPYLFLKNYSYPSPTQSLFSSDTLMEKIHVHSHPHHLTRFASLYLSRNTGCCVVMSMQQEIPTRNSWEWSTHRINTGTQSIHQCCTSSDLDYWHRTLWANYFLLNYSDERICHLRNCLVVPNFYRGWTLKWRAYPWTWNKTEIVVV